MSRVPLTIPNVLGFFRLLASPGLVLVAAAGRDTFFLGLFLLLEATDWLDGKLADRLQQRTAFGARLDTLADLTMYAGLVVGLVLLEGSTFLDEWPWIAPALASYVLSWLLSLRKFRVPPSYHTWSAKISWFLALVAAVALLALDHVWPIRVAAAAVTLANLEASALTLKLDRPRTDVRWVFDAPAPGEETR